jgi:hypothetical protein
LRLGLSCSEELHEVYRLDRYLLVILSLWDFLQIASLQGPLKRSYVDWSLGGLMHALRLTGHSLLASELALLERNLLLEHLLSELLILKAHKLVDYVAGESPLNVILGMHFYYC